MKHTVKNKLDCLITSYPALSAIEQDIADASRLLRECVDYDGVIYVCGNGGSAADCEHIVGELMKSFQCKRALSDSECEMFYEKYGDDGLKIAKSLEHSIRAVSLVSQVGLSTAFANDVGAGNVYAQQIYGYGREHDLLWAISTSGNSANVVGAAMAARVKNIKVIGMTGERGGRLGGLSDVCIKVPSCDTARIQEYHLPVYHCLCAMLEAEFYADG